MKFKKNKLYTIRFYDHAITSSHRVVECTAVGWFNCEDEKSISLAHWICHDEELSENTELSNIVKSCILEVRELGVGRKVKQK